MRLVPRKGWFYCVYWVFTYYNSCIGLAVHRLLVYIHCSEFIEGHQTSQCWWLTVGLCGGLIELWNCGSELMTSRWLQQAEMRRSPVLFSRATITFDVLTFVECVAYKCLFLRVRHWQWIIVFCLFVNRWWFRYIRLLNFKCRPNVRPINVTVDWLSLHGSWQLRGRTEMQNLSEVHLHRPTTSWTHEMEFANNQRKAEAKIGLLANPIELRTAVFYQGKHFRTPISIEHERVVILVASKGSTGCHCV